MRFPNGDVRTTTPAMIVYYYAVRLLVRMTVDVVESCSCLRTAYIRINRRPRRRTRRTATRASRSTSLRTDRSVLVKHLSWCWIGGSDPTWVWRNGGRLTRHARPRLYNNNNKQQAERHFPSGVKEILAPGSAKVIRKVPSSPAGAAGAVAAAAAAAGGGR